MTQSHEPSYYEIALTNRQVLIVFVVLLIFMGLRSGVVIGAVVWTWHWPLNGLRAERSAASWAPTPQLRCDPGLRQACSGAEMTADARMAPDASIVRWW